jgi:YHS domain-containing protein
VNSSHRFNRFLASPWHTFCFIELLLPHINVLTEIQLSHNIRISTTNPCLHYHSFYLFRHRTNFLCTKFKTKYKGETYYFCAPGCQRLLKRRQKNMLAEHKDRDVRDTNGKYKQHISGSSYTLTQIPFG